MGVGYSSITPSINVNTDSAQLRTELLNTFNRLDGQLSRAPIRIATQNGPAGNVSTNETTLFTTTITPGTIGKVGSSLLIFACGKFAANGNTKELKLVLGSTNILDLTTTSNNGSWTLQAEVVYNGGSAQIAWGQIFTSGGIDPNVSVSLLTEALASNKVLKITGTGDATDDLAAYYWKVLLLA